MLGMASKSGAGDWNLALRRQYRNQRNGRLLDTPELKAFYKKVSELNVPILVHGLGALCATAKASTSIPRSAR